MTLLARLAELDGRLVPAAARGLRSAVGTGPVCGGALQRLDDRYAATGPLAALRREPRLGLAVSAALLLLAAATVVVRDGHGTADGTADGGPGVRPVLSGGELGPAPGEDVEAYLAASLAGAEDAARRSPSLEHLALLSLDAPATAGQAQALSAGVQVRAAYLAGSGAAGAVVRVEVRDLVPDVARAGGTGSVLALLVSGPAALLSDLGRVPGVRAVELADPSTDADGLSASVLRPSTPGTAP